MVRKLHIKESVNKMEDKVYDNVALLGYACTLAANDLHHIHLCAEGDKFQEIHETADQYLSYVRNLNDFCLELAKEGGLSLYNETYSLDVIKDSGNDWKVQEKDSYNFVEAFTEMSNILTDLSQFIMIIQQMDGVTSDVSSEFDTYLRNFTKAVNYFIEKKLANGEDILTSQNESVRRNRRRTVSEAISDKDIKLVMNTAVDVQTRDDLDAVMGSLLSIDKQMYKYYSEKIRRNEFSSAYIGKCISDDLYDKLRINFKESASSKKYTGRTWGEFIKDIEANSDWVVDSVDRNSFGGQIHNSILLYNKNKDGVYVGEVTKYSDGSYELMDYNITETNDWNE